MCFLVAIIAFLLGGVTVIALEINELESFLDGILNLFSM